MLGFESYSPDYKDDAKKAGVLHWPLKFDLPAAEWKTINRADLVFEGVNHIGMSYEVRIFLNKKTVTGKSARTAANNYAGRFVVFGHGNCFGADGHCDPVDQSIMRSAAESSVTQLRHPAAPHKRILTVTKPLGRVLKKFKNGLHTVTLVTTLKAPTRKECKPVSGLFEASRVSLQLYR